MDESCRRLAFSEFYADYLAHHRHPANRALHLLAKLLALGGVAAALAARRPLLLLAVPALAVGPCWLGHLWFEGNRPVSWTRPSASLLGTLWTWLRRGLPQRPAPASPAGRVRAPWPPGVRGYYSFLADLRMCGAMLSRGVPARESSDPT